MRRPPDAEIESGMRRLDRLFELAVEQTIAGGNGCARRSACLRLLEPDFSSYPVAAPKILPGAGHTEPIRVAAQEYERRVAAWLAAATAPTTGNRR